MKWKPKEGERFWFIASTIMQSFDLLRGRYTKNGLEYRHIKSDNCFRTKKEAQAKLNAIKKILKGE